MTPMELAQLGMKSGLKVATCEDLLKRGWEYVEELNQPAKWVRKGPISPRGNDNA